MLFGTLGHSKLRKALRDQHQDKNRKSNKLRFLLSVLFSQRISEELHYSRKLHEQCFGPLLQGFDLRSGFGNSRHLKFDLHLGVFEGGFQVLLRNQ